MDRFDWVAIRKDYITHPDMTLHKIAKKYKIREGTVTKRSSDEGWHNKKKEYMMKLTDKVVEKELSRQARALSKELASAEKIGDVVNRMLEDSQQFHRYLVQEGSKGDFRTVEKVSEKVDTRAMREAMQTLKMVEEMKRAILDIQKLDQIQRAKYEQERLALEKERLELEKERVAILKQKDVADLGEFGVVIMPEVLSDANTTETKAPESPESDEKGDGGINGQ